MAMSRRVLARSVVDQLLSGTSAKTLMPQLAAYIVEQRLTAHTEEIIGDIAYELSRRGDVEVAVTTARPLTEELRALVMEFVRQSDRKATDITLIETVDESFIGGIVIETPDKRFDASVASSLKQLKTT